MYQPVLNPVEPSKKTFSMEPLLSTEGGIRSDHTPPPAHRLALSEVPDEPDISKLGLETMRLVPARLGLHCPFSGHDVQCFLCGFWS